MRLTAIILLAGCLHVAAKVNSQTITFSAKNADLESVFSVIKKQTGFTVLVNKVNMEKTVPVNIDAVNMPLEEFLSMVFKNQPLSYNIEAQTIFLSKKLTLPTITEKLETEQPPVTGVVKDSAGAPLAGATITNRRTKKSAQADVKGEFIIEANEGDELVISFIGFESKSLRVSGNKVLAILIHSKSPLDEVQIIAYGQTSRRLNTGTVYTVKGEEIAKQPVTNPIMALQGRVPNLIISPTSGLPNAAINVQMRGQNSLNLASLRSEPLVIIDGVPYQNTVQAGIAGSLSINGDQVSALSLFNINDIEQIDVLSDADATSIYGSRGGNGVILITTKKGKVGATSINVSVSTGMSQVPKTLDLLNTDEYIQLRKQAFKNDNLQEPDKNSPANANNYDLTVWDDKRYTDWQKEFLGGTASNYTGDISVNGGSPNVQYMLSGNFTTQKYIFPGKNKFQTGSTSLSISANSLNGRFKAQLNNSVSFNNTVTPSADFTRVAVTLPPNAPAIYSSDGTLNWEAETSTGNNVATWVNPYAQLLRTAESSNSNLRESINLSYEFPIGLSLKASAGYAGFQLHSLTLHPIAAQNPFFTSNTGLAMRTDSKTSSFTFDPQIIYNRAFGKVKLAALIGASYQTQNQELQYLESGGYTSDALLKSIAAAATTTGLNTSVDYKYVAGFGRLNANVLDKYLMTLSARRDGSSRFGPNNQFGNFWSVGAAWIFTQEEFFKTIFPEMTFGKIKIGYGTSGNDGINDYQYIELYQPNGFNLYQGNGSLQSSGAVNSYYHWESIKKLDLSLETGFLNDRILFTTSFWRTRGSDQLGSFPLPATAGNSSIVKNQDARIQNMGWDFLLTSRNVIRKNFTWTSSINLGFQNNKLLARPEGLFNGYGFNRFVVVGEPFTGFAIGYKSKGVNIANGLYQFENIEKNITVDPDNVAIDGVKVNTIPITMGINNSFTFKGLSCSFFVQLTKQVGRNFVFDPVFTNYNPGSFSSDPGIEHGNLPIEYLNTWQASGDVSEFQKLTSGSFTNPMKRILNQAAVSDLAWADASFIRLRNVSISYSLFPEWSKKHHLSNIIVFINAQNLITITPYKGLDPEVQSATSLPLLRTVMGGLRIGL